MRLKKIWSGSIDNIGWAAMIIGLSSFISRFLGVFRDHILAGQFGAGDELDIYYAAFRVPDLIFNLLVLGALSAGFIPIFVSLLNKTNNLKDDQMVKEDNQTAWRFANLVSSSLLVIIMALSVVGIIFAPYLLKLLTPGFSPEKLVTTVQLSRWMFLSPLLLGLSGVIGGILQSFKSFFAYSLSPIFYNLGIISGALFLAPRFGLIGLAWGVVIGAGLHLLVQLPALFKLGFRFKFTLDWQDKHLRQIGRIMIPRTMGLAVGQLNLVMMTVIASSLASGSLAIFSLANNLQSFPVGIFGLSLAVAAFPTMSVLIDQPEKLKNSLTKTIRQAMFLIIPATILILSLRAQIIRVVLGSGRFDWQDTILTMRTLSYFGLSILSQSLIAILVRVFYAYKNSITPFWTGLVSAVMTIGLAWWWSQLLGVAGLALAFSAGNLVNLFLLWCFLKKTSNVLDSKNIINGFWRMFLAATLAWPAIFKTKELVAPMVKMDTFLGIASQLTISGLVGSTVYLVACLLLKCPEARQLCQAVGYKLSDQRRSIIDADEARGL